ncbi:MAG: YdeI/OmpD-associated family protein [Flavobacteriales bacterium]|nr:YdeI/OmpD-associated family protein [Flavobacteriales bacterium]HRH69736.1 YdeI/OmpD-associated family protein [Flavobacteriales bacterium]
MHAQEQINLYIADQPEWQRRLLVRMRQLIHSTDENVEETWRWNGPHFDHDGIMLGMAGFKTCVSVWFHKGSLIKDTHGVFEKLEKGEDKGNRVYKLHEGDKIDEKAFVDLLKQAIKVNQSGAKLSDARPTKKTLTVPPDLEGCLKKDEEAWMHWEKFNYTHKKEYVEWITDAKQDETRKRRIAQALEMIRDGMGKEDKYKVK